MLISPILDIRKGKEENLPSLYRILKLIKVIYQIKL
tara:strand:+ start:1293 stop:1400 length:108 start_codon:yes stop_codon:yes gene_type:complete